MTPAKKFFYTILRGMVVFGIVTFISFHLRSDDLFTPDMPDAMDRSGFPFLIYQQGGPVVLDYYSPLALWADFAFALAATELASLSYPRVRRMYFQRSPLD
ncbi:MAG TPA: hypothetical protein VH413_20245 [Verrucomicrobiae bacterium]|nr:hypothetical protein [Verrucomicrobiae bacterium]